MFNNLLFVIINWVHYRYNELLIIIDFAGGKLSTCIGRWILRVSDFSGNQHGVEYFLLSTYFAQNRAPTWILLEILRTRARDLSLVIKISCIKAQQLISCREVFIVWIIFDWRLFLSSLSLYWWFLISVFHFLWLTCKTIFSIFLQPKTSFLCKLHFNTQPGRLGRSRVGWPRNRGFSTVET